MSGPCRGDSGGGLFVKKGETYYLKGLVSASLTSLGQCDVTNFALYTNVEKFIDWIGEPTEELFVANQPSRPSFSNNGACTITSESTSLNSIELECVFTTLGGLYTCKAEKLVIENQNVEIKAIRGDHEQGKNNSNVEQFQITAQDTEFLPACISNFFENLKVIKVTESDLNFVNQSDLSRLKKLTSLDLDHNSISMIPENTFDEIYLLETLTLKNNKIRGSS